MMGLPGRQEREGLGVRFMFCLKPVPPGLVNGGGRPSGVSPRADPA